MEERHGANRNSRMKTIHGYRETYAKERKISYGVAGKERKEARESTKGGEEGHSPFPLRSSSRSQTRSNPLIPRPAPDTRSSKRPAGLCCRY